MIVDITLLRKLIYLKLCSLC